MLIWVKRLSLGLVVFLVVAQVIRPSRTNPPVDRAREIGATLSLTPVVAAILERSCNDCHSNRTVWLWYSGVAPASWLVAYDVYEGRRRMNFSEWDTHSPEEHKKLLDRTCPDAKSGEMPGFPYLLMHPGAKLSAEDVQVVCNWTQAAREATSAQGKKLKYIPSLPDSLPSRFAPMLGQTLMSSNR
jgi:hypothetical protein